MIQPKKSELEEFLDNWSFGNRFSRVNTRLSQYEVVYV